MFGENPTLWQHCGGPGKEGLLLETKKPVFCLKICVDVLQRKYHIECIATLAPRSTSIAQSNRSSICACALASTYYFRARARKTEPEGLTPLWLNVISISKINHKGKKYFKTTLPIQRSEQEVRSLRHDSLIGGVLSFSSSSHHTVGLIGGGRE